MYDNIKYIQGDLTYVTCEFQKEGREDGSEERSKEARKGSVKELKLMTGVCGFYQTYGFLGPLYFC